MQQIVREFPDYSVADLPSIPEGFEDSSWHNDACPSFTNDALALILYVDFAKPEDRETPKMNRFSLHKLDVEGCMTDADPVVSTEDWNEVLRAVEAAR